MPKFWRRREPRRLLSYGPPVLESSPPLLDSTSDVRYSASLLLFLTALLAGGQTLEASAPSAETAIDWLQDYVRIDSSTLEGTRGDYKSYVKDQRSSSGSGFNALAAAFKRLDDGAGS